MKSSGIGGQAVLEGVMMKNKEQYAVAVRKPDNEIAVEIKEYQGIGNGNKIIKAPIIRGVIAFADSMVLGVRALTYSASFYEEEEEIKKDSKKKDGVLSFLVVLLSICIAIGLFVALPMFLSDLFSKVITSSIVLGFIEGIIRVLLLVGYIVSISFMKDINRTFMYHGAEHKTINCIERGYDLTVSNVRKQSRKHKRCGTSFLLFVAFISIIVFLFIRVDQIWLRVVLRVLLVPVVAGISYELIRYAGSHDNVLVTIISAPGMLMQRLTTKEPDDKMIEVAIASVDAVFDWQGYLEGIKGKSAKRKHSNKKGKNQSKSNQKIKEDTEEIEEIEDIEAEVFAANLEEDLNINTKQETNKVEKKSKQTTTNSTKINSKNNQNKAHQAVKDENKEEIKTKENNKVSQGSKSTQNSKNTQSGENAQSSKNAQGGKNTQSGENTQSGKNTQESKNTQNDTLTSNVDSSEEFKNLDKLLYEMPEVAVEEKQNKLKERARNQEQVVLSSTEIAASLESTEEEDDEILRALDKYFSSGKDA
ncbi:DUF1385 domain-containing protein [Lachnoclostridium phytofermentans]|uniref:DUF1385 domain-containing protein n=1 Tax=Lachnoclostridium phytofermentans (strain ATCC 700394 / DSM 18823 / ISDg) TaxID=357809 RepID=A9KHD2_LACP7|nr:DUF1385 domain-containing protein [Lachnoclostridium phytofermentans]ABX40799.1 protein of unknown function DUF1385 [Lachnoclostridium phytofermentans ISDg]